MLQTGDQARQVGRDEKKNKVEKEVMVDNRDGRDRKKCLDDLAGKGMKEQVSSLMIFGDMEERHLKKRKKKKRKMNDLFVDNEEHFEGKETKKKKRASVIFFNGEERDTKDDTISSIQELKKVKRKKKNKKRQKNDLFVGYEEQLEVKETNKKKRASVTFLGNEERDAEDREEGVGFSTRNKERTHESMKQMMDIIKVNKAKGERKKGMEKDAKDDTIACIQEQKKAKGKKKNKKKRKNDLFVGYEEQLEVKETKKKKRAFVTFFNNEEKDVEGREEAVSLLTRNKERIHESMKKKIDIIKVDRKNGEGRKRMEKDTKDDTFSSIQEQKKVKRKKKSKNEIRDNVKAFDTHSGNKAETLRLKGCSRVKMKLDGGEVGKKPGCGVQKPIEKDSFADSSKHVTPESHSEKLRLPEEVKSFPPSDSSINFNDNEGGLVQGKRFSKEEDEIIRKAVAEYIEANRLGEKGLNMILNSRSYPKVKGCWQAIAAALPWRLKTSVNKRAHMLFERGDSKWTPEELQIVMEAHEKYGPNWRMMADKLGKFRVHVKEKWRMNRLINRKKGKWSQDEYQALFQLVNKDLQKRVFEEKKSKHGLLRDNISWQAISDDLGTRIHTCCCRKWYHQLSSPMVAAGKWADVDDYRMLMVLVDLDASCEDEVEWDSLLEHRLGDTCQKRWQQMVRHLAEHGNKSFSEQVEVLSRRYCPDLLQVRETFDSREVVD